MKTALAGLNPGAASSASQAAATHASAKADESNAQEKPQFDRLMEKKAAHAKSASSAGKDGKASVAEVEEKPEQESSKTERATRKPKAAEDWPPFGLATQLPAFPETAPLTVPASPLELAANAQALQLSEAGMTEAPLMAASVAPTASGDAASFAPVVGNATTAGTVTDVAPATTSGLAADAPMPDVLMTDLAGADVQVTLPAHAESSNPAKPALQNLLSFASHLANGNPIAAAPEAIALVKDVVDALSSEGEAEPASPSTNLMAGSTTTSSNGLARTATVNPLEAPMPDLHNEQFDEAVGTRLTWMAEQKIGHAHIKISPNDLGTVEVRLRLDGDRVHADFSSAQPEVRQALENSLPKLRDMLGQHGFQLAQADVGHHQNSHPAPNTLGAGDHNGSEDAGLASEALLPRPVRVTAHGLLDAYA
ncbi:flagellar hook-length control protein FliK [Pseudoxanthomonas sp. UTMC 1351]|uniref:flagellar hook-length control protein FliK n=1 Tax=Pseudoxanthomonas sp. UTMC 1351 TaxID=2695853 RepID=UPI0034CE97AB